MASEGGTEDAKRRGDAFARAFSAHLARYCSSYNKQKILEDLDFLCVLLPLAVD